MTVRPITMFPDRRLKEVAVPVAVFDGELAALAADLLETMRAAPGIGITACHIGVPVRLVVLELPGDLGATFYVNPSLAWASPDRVLYLEGSVSMPGITEEVERAARVRVSYRHLDGTVREEEAEGLRAVCHQHEIDQLDGIFWLQRLSRLKRERTIRRYEKMRRAGMPGAAW